MSGKPKVIEDLFCEVSENFRKDIGAYGPCGRPAVARVRVLARHNLLTLKAGESIPTEQKGACLEHYSQYVPQPKRCPVCDRPLWTRNRPWMEWMDWYCPADDSHYSESYWPKDRARDEMTLPPGMSARCVGWHWACQADGLIQCPTCGKQLHTALGPVSLDDEERAVLEWTLRWQHEHLVEVGRLCDETDERLRQLEQRTGIGARA